MTQQDVLFVDRSIFNYGKIFYKKTKAHNLCSTVPAAHLCYMGQAVCIHHYHPSKCQHTLYIDGVYAVAGFLSTERKKTTNIIGHVKAPVY